MVSIQPQNTQNIMPGGCIKTDKQAELLSHIDRVNFLLLALDPSHNFVGQAAIYKGSILEGLKEELNFFEGKLKQMIETCILSPKSIQAGSYITLLSNLIPVLESHWNMSQKYYNTDDKSLLKADFNNLDSQYESSLNKAFLHSYFLAAISSFPDEVLINDTILLACNLGSVEELFYPTLNLSLNAIELPNTDFANNALSLEVLMNIFHQCQEYLPQDSNLKTKMTEVSNALLHAVFTSRLLLSKNFDDDSKLLEAKTRAVDAFKNFLNHLSAIKK